MLNCLLMEKMPRVYNPKRQTATKNTPTTAIPLLLFITATTILTLIVATTVVMQQQQAYAANSNKNTVSQSSTGTTNQSCSYTANSPNGIITTICSVSLIMQNNQIAG